MKTDFEQIKKTTDIIAVVESYGITLRKAGLDHVGLCPFHDDSKPSLRVTQSKGLFRCPSCEATGNVIQFVARKEGMTDREAALKLCTSIPGVRLASELPSDGVKPSANGCNVTLPANGCSVTLPEAKLFGSVVEHYHETLFGRDRRGLDYLKKRGLGDVETLHHFKVGFVNGTLLKKLSPAQRKAAGVLLNEAGNERFYLRVVVPILDENAQPVGLYGRSIQEEAEVKHLYLAGEHRAVWNGAAVAVYPDELIVTEAILDGLAIFAAGNKNVISCYGAGGWTPHHDALIEKHHVKKLVFAFDNDERGQSAALGLAPKCEVSHRIKWPEGVKDACDYFQYHREIDFKGTPESFTSLLAVAPRIGFTRPCPEAPKAALSVVEKTDESITIQNGTVNYRIKGLTASGSMKVVLTAKARAGQPDEATHIDHFDLYFNRGRKMFSMAAAERLQVDQQKLEEDLMGLLTLLEGLRNQDHAQAASPVKPQMSEEARQEAISFLRAPQLLDLIAQGLEVVGYVGEDRNKKLAYLIGTSRRLPKPLSAIFRAQSGCGKSFLMECVAELMPPEDVHYFSRLTPQALYYLEPDALTHKLLIVDERDGSEESEYPIRTLQTRRILKLAVPIKDPNSGKIKTTILEIHGPIAYMESTTSQQINPENANRCFELYLDETESQTRAVFAAQRRSRTLEGWQTERLKEKTLAVHHNAQRLLRPLKVIIPYVELIEFPASWLRGRRDNDRFLSLIEGVAFLHQMQRRVVENQGAEYIEADMEDYRQAYDLAHQVFAQAGSEVPKPVADFLTQVERFVEAQAKKNKGSIAEFWFSRRMVREAIRLPDHLIKSYMRQIEDLEYVQVQKAPQGGSFRYRLLPAKQAPALLAGLTSPESLAEKWKKWVKSGNRPKTDSNP